MAQLFTIEENPLQIVKFGFIEWSSQDQKSFSHLCMQLGLRHTGDVWSACEDVIFIHNSEDKAFISKHHQGVRSVGFIVKDSQKARELSVHYSHILTHHPLLEKHNLPCIQAVAGVIFYFLTQAEHDQIFFSSLKSHKEVKPTGLMTIDHIAFNLFLNNKQKEHEFLTQILGFRHQSDFEIKGLVTSFKTSAYQCKETDLSIVLSTSEDPRSQISQFLNVFKGEGLQHLAFSTSNIFEIVTQWKKSGLQFQTTPDSYFVALQEKFNHLNLEQNEFLEKVRTHQILLDSTSEMNEYLLQIFTKETYGPLFFELVERQGKNGFGEDNIKALFESVEREQFAQAV